MQSMMVYAKSARHLGEGLVAIPARARAENALGQYRLQKGESEESSLACANEMLTACAMAVEKISKVCFSFAMVLLGIIGSLHAQTPLHDPNLHTAGPEALQQLQMNEFGKRLSKIAKPTTQGDACVSTWHRILGGALAKGDMKSSKQSLYLFAIQAR